jgi:hypothetical protein
MKGIVDESEQVLVLYIDGVAATKYVDPKEAEDALRQMKKKFPRKEIELRTETHEEVELDENLHKWFKEKWVRFGPDGKIRGACARGSDSEGKPKCLPQKKAQNLGKKGRKYAASKKRREDPNPDRRGAAKNVATKKKTNEEQMDENCWKGYHKEGNKKMFGKTVPNCVKNEGQELEEKWSEKYKRSIDCSHPKGFSQKAHCAGRKKNEDRQKCPECGGSMYPESMINEKQDACYYKVKSRYKVWPSAYASGALVQCRKKGAKNWGTKSESVKEAANAAQQAAIAINMKKHHQKPKHVKENQLNELFDKPLPIKWTRFRDGQQGDFAITVTDPNTGKEVVHDYELAILYSNNRNIYYYDEIISPTRMASFIKQHKNHGLIISFSRWVNDNESEYDLTGDLGPAAAQVLATVMHHVVNFVKNSNTTWVTFTGSGESRRKLYQLLVKRVSSQMGWRSRQCTEGDTAQFMAWTPALDHEYWQGCHPIVHPIPGTDQFESRSDSRKTIRRKETNTMYRESKNPKSTKSTMNSGVQRRGQIKNKVKEARLREYGEFHPDKTDFSTGEKLKNFIKEKVTPVLGAVAASAIIALGQGDNFINLLKFIKNTLGNAIGLNEEYSISRSSMKQYVMEAAVKSKNPNVMKFIQTVFASKVPLKKVVGVIDEILKYANSLKTKKVAENMNYKPSRIPTKGSYNSSMSRTNRGVMREMPDTSGPVGTQPGGWRDRRTFEDTAYASGMGQGGNAGQSYRKFKPKMAGTTNEEMLDESIPWTQLIPYMRPDEWFQFFQGLVAAGAFVGAGGMTLATFTKALADFVTKKKK